MNDTIENSSHFQVCLVGGKPLRRRILSPLPIVRRGDEFFISNHSGEAIGGFLILVYLGDDSFISRAVVLPDKTEIEPSFYVDTEAKIAYAREECQAGSILRLIHEGQNIFGL